MLDDAPWFRRWVGFSYLPINWKGYAAIAVWLAVEAPLIILGDRAAAYSPLWWLSAAGAFLAFLLFWAFVEWKIDNR